MSICDCCNGEISKGDGYAGWSEIEVEGIEIGALLFCKKCANRLYTEQVWAEAMPRQLRKHWRTVIKILRKDCSPTPEDLLKIRKAHDCWIAARAKARGLSPSKARSEARKIAKIWWDDKDEAMRRMIFPRYSSGNIAEIAEMEEKFGKEKVWGKSIPILTRSAMRILRKEQRHRDSQKKS